MPDVSRLPPDLEPSERTIARQVASLEIVEPPAALRARVLGAALEPAMRILPRAHRWQVGLAAAALVLAAFGLFAFTEAASRVTPEATPADGMVAVVDDPSMPVFRSLEPIGSLGPDDEVIADAGS